MENPGDKFASLLLPNCQRTASQEEKLKSCHLARESKVSSDDILIHSSSSPDESPEHPTGIEMVSLPDSFDEYQTPPEHHSCSQNSSNEGLVAATKTTAFDEQKVVDLANEEDNLDTEPMDVDVGVDETKVVTEDLETEVISSPEKMAHKVFVEMPEREKESEETRKRKLPISISTQKQNSDNLSFEDILKVVMKIVEVRSGGGGENDGDFMAAAIKKGLIGPRPRWWPKEW